MARNSRHNLSLRRGRTRNGLGIAIATSLLLFPLNPSTAGVQSSVQQSAAHPLTQPIDEIAPEQRLVEAKAAFDEGVQLVQQGTPEALKAAIPNLERALALYQAVDRGEAKAKEAETLLGIGLVYNRLGDFQLSLEAYQKAFSYYQRSNDPLGQAYTLNQMGKILFDLGDLKQALEAYQTALPLYQEVQDVKAEAYTLNNIGAVYEPLGEYQKALDSYNKALKLYEQVENIPGLASTLNNIGLLYDSLGEYQLSLDYYQRSLPLWEKIQDRRGEASTLNNLGLYYDATNEDDRAITAYQQALTIYKQLEDFRGQATTLNNIGFVHANLNQLSQALEAYKQALPLWQNLGNRAGLSSTLNNLGVVYANLGNDDEAIQHYNQALKLRQEIGDRAKEALSRYRLAISQRAKGSLEEAVQQIELALAIVEDLRTNVVSQDLRTSFFASKQEYYEFYIDLLMELHQQNPNQGYDSQALQASERAKARSLLDILAESKGEITSGVNPKLLELQQQLQQQLSKLEERRINLLSGEHTETQKQIINREIEDLLNQYRKVEAEIRATSPRYAALTQPRPLTLVEIQSLVLDQDTILLEYALGKERSYLWVVTQDSLQSYVLPGREQIETAVRKFRDALILPNQRIRRSITEKAAQELSQLILEPVADQLTDKRLLIVADGGLQYVPFAALPSSQTSSERYIPLMVDHEIVTLPSASTMNILRKELEGRPAAPRALAVLADPVFGKNDERVKGVNDLELPPDLEQSAKESGILFDRLPYTKTEAEQILSLVQNGETKQKFGFEASRKIATSPELSQYRILHFATHGLLNSKNPELSGLVLSLVDETGKPVNGFLRLPEIFNLNLPAELVVLSACETGLGQNVKGEGLVGLTRGFMYAGSARVLVSLWSVDDEATASLMVKFYQEMLQKGLSPSAALRQAQIEVWQQQEWISPYYWAAFTLQGEWHSVAAQKSS